MAQRSRHGLGAVGSVPGFGAYHGKGEVVVQLGGLAGKSFRNGHGIQARSLGDLKGSVVPDARSADIPHAGELVAVTCWCDRTVVKVLLDDVVRGQTASCGRRGCQPPTGR